MSSLHSFAQNKEVADVKHVLIIPFSRFEFHTELKLSWINEVSKMEKDQYFTSLVQAFSDAFALGLHGNTRYHVISNDDFRAIIPYIKFNFIGNNGHYSSDLDQLHLNIYKKLLEDYKCDYVLIVNWYKILEKKESVKLKGLRKYGKYSLHTLDYDFYDNRKQLLSFGSNIKFMVEPTESNLQYGGLRISDLRVVYKELSDRITEDINK